MKSASTCDIQCELYSKFSRIIVHRVPTKEETSAVIWLHLAQNVFQNK